jgi:glycerol kinase
LARTIAWQIAASRPTFALEGNVVAAGTAVRWVADLLGCEEATLTRLADNADDSDVVLVPAFNGLGAPYWDPAARAVLVGMTQATGAAQLARAAVESVAFQVADTFALIDTALGGTRHLRADGGASTSNMLMRFLADLVNRPVLRAVNSEASAVGAAYLAGLAAGQWTEDDIESLAGNAQEFLPKASAEWRARNFGRWHDALARARLTSGQY